jgi:filamentous hemagglutinin family protein
MRNLSKIYGSLKVKLKNIIAFSATVFFVSIAYSNPSLNNVESGNVAVSQTATTTTVNQGSQQAIINWNSFNIGAGEKTQFVQPNASSVALNRINSSQGASQIYGSLSSNGRIILINGAGIHFGPGAIVNVGGLIASTSDISNANFLAGNYNFNIPSPLGGSIINEGTIIAAKNGLVALLGSNVRNDGMIQAQSGSIVLGSGNKFTLDFYGDQLINFSVDDAATTGGKIKNTGTLLADGGKILITAKAAAGVIDNVIDMQGVAQARSVYEHNGEIILSGNGEVSVSGKLNASGRGHHSTGGTIKILGSRVHLLSTANLNANGAAGGGTILVGGNFHGAGSEQNALNTTVDSGAILQANALKTGNGGQVAVWSNNATQFAGSISATGGALSGNGGYVETSGEYLAVGGAKINLLAPHGLTGNWLLDPTDLTISTNATSNTTGTYTANQTSSSVVPNLNVTDLNNALSTANVTVSTSAGGIGGLGDIIIGQTETVSGGALTSSPVTISWSAGNTLTISAFRNVVLATGSSILGTSSTGNLVLNAATGSLNINGTITTAGSQTYNNTVAFGSAATTLNAGTSSVIFNAPVTATGSLTFSSPTTINGGSVTSSGTQIYNGLVSLGTAATTLSTTAASGDIVIAGGLTWSGSNNLTLSAYRNVVLKNSNITNSSGGATVNLIADNTGNWNTYAGTGAMGKVCGGGNSNCTGYTPASGFVSTSGAVNVYYDPTTFGTQQTAYSGGTSPAQFMLINELGSASDAATINSLGAFSKNSSLWSANFALGTNIDASITNPANGSPITGSAWTTGGFVPIANAATYTGNFNGLNHTINNLYIYLPSAAAPVGLFSQANGSISNLGLVNPNITGKDYTGGIMG